MNISTEKRREQIISIIQENGKVKVSELSEKYGISEVSIRKDLELLEAEQNAGKLDNLIKTTRHVSVNEKIKHVLKTLTERGDCKFASLFEHAESRNEIVATFMAVLELIKSRRIRVEDLNEKCDDCRLVLESGNDDDTEIITEFT